jgi:hypothetical protein
MLLSIEDKGEGNIVFVLLLSLCFFFLRILIALGFASNPTTLPSEPANQWQQYKRIT